MSRQEQLKQEILEKTKEYYNLVHNKSSEEFIENESRVNYAGRVFDEKEMVNLIDSSLEFWLTNGRFSEEFEKNLAKFLGLRFSLLVNSGSSANLLAFMALTSPTLNNRRIKRGDEVITIASGFPTTVAPIVQYGAIPVFIDINLSTVNIDVTQLENALSSKTKAIMIAHTLGNPFNVKAVKDFCNKHNLWLVEDNCDALGSKYNEQYTGTFGDIGTSSFYPPHHITMGEGGAVYTNNNQLKKILLSLRDWGRDCWCNSGKDNTCGKRFKQNMGKLPLGYDHKYIYSHFGYNLKPTDLQASIGCAQLEKLEEFTKKRKKHFQMLHDGLQHLTEHFILPQATPQSDPNWFGFLLTLRDNTKYTRNEIVEFLENNNIQTRNLFAGNITLHPCFDILKKNDDYRIIGSLKNTNKIMNDSFWLGVYPGMKEAALQYMIKKIIEIIEKKTFKHFNIIS